MRSRPLPRLCRHDKLALVADHKDTDSAVRPSPSGAARFLPLVAGLGAVVVFLPAFERAVALRPGYAEAWNNLGVAAALQGQGEAPMDAFRRAAAADPSFAGRETTSA